MTVQPCSRHFWHVGCAVIFATTLVSASWRGLTEPIHNWDMFAYVGTAVSWSEHDRQASYDKTVADSVSEIGGIPTHDLVTNILADNPESFRQQLPFYAVKPLYIALMIAVHALGDTYTAATWQISAVSFLLLGLALALWRPRLDLGWWLLLVAAVIALPPAPMAILARLSTPDALATLLVVVSLYCLLKRRTLAGFAVAGTLTLLARPDAAIVLVLACLLAGVVRDDDLRLSRRAVAGCAALFVAAYFSVQKLAGAYSLKALFYYTFIERLARPADTHVHLRAPAYLQVISEHFPQLCQDPLILSTAVVTLVALAFHALSEGPRRLWLWLLVLTWVALLARFLLHPNTSENRYFYPNFLIALIAAAEITGGAFASPRPWLASLFRRGSTLVTPLKRNPSGPR